MVDDLGYDDTPELPHCEYLVHDSIRPQPPKVTPGSSKLHSVEPPSDATILFGGDNLNNWEGSDSGPTDWKVQDDYLEVKPGANDIQTTASIGNCQLHIEWMVPATVSGCGQQRGNSGVFLVDRYEIQVLDSYNNPTYADGYAGAIYGQHPPSVNPCRKPGEWQSFDIIWHSPRFSGDELQHPARVSVFLNDIIVQDNTKLIGPTSHREIEPYVHHPPKGPLRLQDHGDPVRFRNIWYRSLNTKD